MIHTKAQSINKEMTGSPNKSMNRLCSELDGKETQNVLFCFIFQKLPWLLVKWIKNISIEQIEIAYINRMDDLVRKAEETLDINDYNNAMLYLRNITDESKRKEYEKILSEIKSQIDEMNAIVEEPEIDQSEIVETARKYIGQNVGRDCSGFVKYNVLRPLNYLQDDISSASGYCDGRSRGSYGMYLKYKEKGQEVWHRDSGRHPQCLCLYPPGRRRHALFRRRRTPGDLRHAHADRVSRQGHTECALCRHPLFRRHPSGHRRIGPGLFPDGQAGPG